jgi:hypothetical protein
MKENPQVMQQSSTHVFLDGKKLLSLQLELEN